MDVHCCPEIHIVVLKSTYCVIKYRFKVANHLRHITWVGKCPPTNGDSFHTCKAETPYLLEIFGIQQKDTQELSIIKFCPSHDSSFGLYPTSIFFWGGCFKHAPLEPWQGKIIINDPPAFFVDDFSAAKIPSIYHVYHGRSMEQVAAPFGASSAQNCKFQEFHQDQPSEGL